MTTADQDFQAPVYSPTVADLMRASHENTLAQQVRYTGPILQGALASFGIHSFFGATLMAIHPLAALAALVPAFLGVRRAIASHQAFTDEYGASVQNPDDWQEFVEPDKLARVQQLGLDTPIRDIIAAGMARGVPELGFPSLQQGRGPQPGKALPPAAGAQQQPAAQQQTTQTSPRQTVNTSSGAASSMPSAPMVTTSTKAASSTKSTNEPQPLAVAPCRLDDAAPHLLLIGRTREGKSETLKFLIGPEDRVWYVTSKATDRVPAHWNAYRVGGRDLPNQMRWLLYQWEAALQLHLDGSDKAREWFVIDEAVGIIQALKLKGAKTLGERLKGFVIEAVTAGAAVGAFSGLLSQTGNAGPLGIDEDLLKNFSIITCGKRKKATMIAAFTKLTGHKFTSDQEQGILSLDGYWQLWEDKGPTLSQVPLSPLETKEVERCPLYYLDQEEPPDLLRPGQPVAATAAIATPSVVNPAPSAAAEPEPEPAPPPASTDPDWHQVAQRLADDQEVPPGTGMRAAVAKLLGRDKLSGPPWQDIRGKICQAAGPELLAQLSRKFPAAKLIQE
ncbi:MAG TPA: hypothetical protein V6D06_16995 [Trichocoleus sp.]